MNLSLGKLRERKWSADMTNVVKLKEDFIKSNRRLKAKFNKYEEEPFINKIESSNILNCENIKISIVMKEESECKIIENHCIKKITHKNLTPLPKKSTGICYGSPALWLKNTKFNPTQESRSFPRQLKSNKPSKISAFNDNFFDLNNSINKDSPVLRKFLQNLESNQDVRTLLFKRKIKSRNILKNNHQNESIIQLKTLLNESKLDNSIKRKKFTNILNFETKNSDNLEKNEIDEIINTEISETSFPITAKVIHCKLKLVNCIDIKQETNNLNILNSLRLSKTHPHSSKSSDSEEDKGTKELKINEVVKNTIDDNSTFKTITDKNCLDSFLNKSIKGVFNWKAGEVIAEGHSSVVYKAFNQDNGYLFVVKRYYKLEDPKQVQTFESEVEIYKRISHPNILRLIDFEVIEKNYYIYLEYASGGSIKDIIDKYGPFNENLIKNFLKQILEGLDYLHLNRVLHRDIKCANILLDEKGIIKLSDFGCSGILNLGNSTSDEFFDSLKGTLPWMAPEVVLQQKYGKKADIWSLGCTILEMSTGEVPWGKLDNFYHAMNKIGKSQDIPFIPSFLSQELKDFIVSCLCKNPKERPSISKLKSHKFIQ